MSLIQSSSFRRTPALFALAFGILCAQHLQAQPSVMTVVGNTLSFGGSCTILRGVDADGLEFSNTGSGQMLNMVTEAVGTWKCNIIRLPLNQDYWFGCGDGDTNGTNYRTLVNNVVNYCSGQGAYVLLDLHWSGTSSSPTAPCGAGWGNAANTKQQPMADQNAVTFWSSLGGVFANNPAVVFDLYNEPYDSGNDNPGTVDTAGYNTWLNGGTLGGASFSTPGMQALLNAVRGAGATNVCLMGGLHWCANLDGLPAGSLTNQGAGVMFAAHIYGTNDGTSQGNWDQEIPPAFLSNYPVLVGEYGPDGTCPPDPGDISAFDSGFFSYLMNTSGIVGSTAWCMYPGSCPDLVSDFSWTPTSWGTDVRNFLQTPVPTCIATPANTGTPTPTHNPSDTVTPTSTPSNTPTVTYTPTATPTVNPCSQVVAAINCGGPQYILGGVTWVADQAYAAGSFGYVSAGNIGTTTSPIANAGSQQNLYKTERYAATLEYKFTVPNGTYLVALKNVDIYCTAPACRVFNVAINGVNVLPNFDIYSEVGEYAADNHAFPVTVSGGLIDIVANASANNAEFAAIEISTFPTCLITNTPTQSYTPSNTFTITPTPTITSTPTITLSPTITLTPTITSTPSSTPTPTVTKTPTPTFSPTNTLPPTATFTVTLSPTSTPVILGITLSAPYPNPIQNAGPVSFEVSAPSPITFTWEVFSLAFRKVAGGSQSVFGNNAFAWNLSDKGGHSVSNGVYYLKLTAQAGGTQTVKIYKILVLR